LKIRRAALTASAMKNSQIRTAPKPKAMRPTTSLAGRVPEKEDVVVKARGPEPNDTQEEIAPMEPTIPNPSNCCIK